MVFLTVCLISGTIWAKPWGVMYIPVKKAADLGMSGVVEYYRGRTGAKRLLKDLEIAQKKGIKIIATIGSVRILDYWDKSSKKLSLEKVRRELAPFCQISNKLTPYLRDGTLWGIRFLDEPHDPTGLDQEVPKENLGEVYRYIKSECLPGVRVGSTAPASYMVGVAYADFAFGQYNHSHPPRDENGRPLSLKEFFSTETALARSHGLRYVASINANRNGANNRTFFSSYLWLCHLSGVDFVTAWQWNRRNYPRPSFKERWADPLVSDLVERIPELCGMQE